MTEEYASFKQIEFMKKLGFGPQSADLTKADARQMIDGKLKEQEKDTQPRVFDTMASKEKPIEHFAAGYTHAKEEEKLKPVKEFHLTPEAVKLGCLNAAIECCKKDMVAGDNRFLDLADKFVEWVYQSS